VSDPATDQRIDADKGTFHEVGGEGLPTLWIDAQRVEGAQGPEVLKHVLDAALASKG
jgi:predicted DsbA family dithiol-disulfide isomerase